MIPVYLCHVPSTGPLRAAFLLACRVRWEQEDGARVQVVTPQGIGCEDEEFQRQRRIYADEATQGDFYVVADDDCLPHPEPFLDEAIRILARYPQYGILSLGQDYEEYRPWRPDWPDYEEHSDAFVMEHVSTGQIRVCRKGAVKDWPPLAGKTYDMAHCEALRKNGLRCGYYRGIKMTHLGRGYSTVWP